MNICNWPLGKVGLHWPSPMEGRTWGYLRIRMTCTLHPIVWVLWVTVFFNLCPSTTHTSHYRAQISQWPTSALQLSTWASRLTNHFWTCKCLAWLYNGKNKDSCQNTRYLILHVISVIILYLCEFSYLEEIPMFHTALKLPGDLLHIQVPVFLVCSFQNYEAKHLYRI